MKKIDKTKWLGLKHYEWFKKYSIHFYSLTCEMDVTKLYYYIKENKLSFFITFMYFVNKGMDQVLELRLREIDDEVYEFEKINPAYTVMTKDGVFDNCESEAGDNFKEYYENAKEAIEIVKNGLNVEKSYNDFTRLDRYFFTCLPWIDFKALTHPMSDDVTKTVPRVAWGKYVIKDEKVLISLNIQVSHMLVDGYPLSQAFNNIQEMLNTLDLLK